jgi:hypothetical protein
MDEYSVAGIAFAIIVLIIFGPLLAIWGLNVLFPVLAIPYTLKTWFAIIVVSGLFRGTVAIPTFIKKD